MCDWTEGTKSKELNLTDGSKGFCDPCIHDICQALNDGGQQTLASCCGHHGRFPANIILLDGRILLIATMEQAEKLYVSEE